MLFTEVNAFVLRVPHGYDHDTQLASFFRRKTRGRIIHEDEPDITDENFRRVTHRLMPGATYNVALLYISGDAAASSEECLDALKERRALLVGAQGLSAIWEQCRTEVPRGKWILSFDVKSALWVVGADGRGDYIVPFVCQSPGDESWSFNTGSFDGRWRDKYFICVTSMDSG